MLRCSIPWTIRIINALQFLFKNPEKKIYHTAIISYLIPPPLLLPWKYDEIKDGAQRVENRRFLLNSNLMKEEEEER